MNDILTYIMYGFTGIFTFESFTKIVAYGLIFDKKAYLRQTGQRILHSIELLIVIGGIAEIIGDLFFKEFSGGGIIKVMRVVRVIRPIAVINKVQSLKLMTIAIQRDLPKLINVIIILVFFITIFAIFCLQLFQGNVYYRCRETAEPIKTPEGKYSWPLTKSEYGQDIICSPVTEPGQKYCPINTYCGNPFDVEWPYKMCPESSTCGNPIDFGMTLEEDGFFDSEELQYGYGTGFRNIFDAIIAVLQHFTIDNWTVIMYNLMQSQSTLLSIIICTFMVFGGNFFLMYLILAVIIQSFEDVIETHGGDNQFIIEGDNGEDIDINKINEKDMKTKLKSAMTIEIVKKVK